MNHWRWPYQLRHRVRSLLARQQADAELDDELEFHLEARTALEIQNGKSPAEAQRIARQAMDGLQQKKEECRDMRRTSVIDNLVRDIRYALRGWRRNPAFTLSALGALALGIGANTAVFSVLQGVLLRPLPVHNPDRLVMIFDAFQQQGVDRGPACIADFLDWKARARSFQSLDAIAGQRFTLTGEGEAEQLAGSSVTAGVFDTLGVQPILGRAFAPGDDKPGAPRKTLISESLWRRRFRSDPAIIGRPIVLNGRPYTVNGVVSDNFQLGGNTDIWAILTLNPPTRRGPFFLRGIARLKPGITVEQAAAEMQTLARAVEQDTPRDYSRLNFPVAGLREVIVGDVRPLLWILSAAVVIVFLIAITNAANLMFARAATRQRETAIRLSIGAGRAQLVRQWLTEAALLALAGGVLGLALARAGVAALQFLAPEGLPRLNEITVDSGVLLFTLSAAAISALAFGLGPALAAARAPLSDSLKEGGRGGESHALRRLRSVLVIGQIGLSVLLLTGAGLFLRSLQQLGNVAPGFQVPPSQVLTMRVSPTGPRYNPTPNLAAYWDQLLARVRAVPGVANASIAITMPPDRLAFTDGYEIEGKPAPAGSEHPSVPVPFVSRDYFQTLGIPLLNGRTFDTRDRAGTPPVTVISETFARRHFPNENPVGRRIRHGNIQGNPFMEIIGVVGNVKYQGVETEDTPVYYELSDQSPSRPMWLLVRTQGDAAALTQTIRGEIRAIDPNVPVDRISTMVEALGESVSLPRFRGFLMSVFAAAALLLAAIGIYGLIAYSVAQRRQEIGIRIALGATRSGVIGLIVGQGGRLAIAGIGIGLAAAAATGRYLEKMLFGITPSDAVTFAAVPLLLAAVAILASLVPALRAAAIDPVTTLRQE